MTHPAYLESEGGYLLDDAPDLMCRAALALGVTDFVLPGTKPELVKSLSESAFRGVKGVKILMPGIGAQGGAIRSAFEAAAPHRRFAIVGRAVYEAPDPRGALVSLAREL
jgi:orotidine-5'-phosphate decarboxylase